MRAAVFALGAMLLWSMPVHSSTFELDHAVSTALLELDTFNKMNVAERRAVVAASLAYWRDFEHRVPQNSPETTAWILSEAIALDHNRSAHLAASPEWAFDQLGKLARRCVTVFELLDQQVGGEPIIELALWMGATPCYTRQDIVTLVDNSGLWTGLGFGEHSFDGMLDAIADKIPSSILDENMPK